MKFTAAALLLASTAFGASSSLIPSGISAGCTSFLEALNGDAKLQACINPLVTATNSFSPVSGKSPSTNDLNAALKSMCSASGCDQASVVGTLNSFYSACRAEIDSGNEKVASLYDVLYVFTPLKGAVCAVDSSTQAYCVNSIRKAGSTGTAGPANTTVNVVVTNPVVAVAQGAADFVANIIPGIAKRAPTQSLSSIVTPNATTYRNTNLPFLFLQPDMTKAQLCTSCTRQIMVNYIKYENAIGYGPGLGNSPILGGQSALWNGIKTVCGESFTGAIVSEAGGNLPASGALSRAAAPAIGVVAGVAALVLAL